MECAESDEAKVEDGSVEAQTMNDDYSESEELKELKS